MAVRTHDIYDDFAGIANELDTSNFETDHPLYSLDNRRVLGKMKSETGSTAPKEFVGLRAKMYSSWVPDAESKSFKKAKGIQKRFVKKKSSSPTVSGCPLKCKEEDHCKISHVSID